MVVKKSAIMAKMPTESERVQRKGETPIECVSILAGKILVHQQHDSIGWTEHAIFPVLSCRTNYETKERCHQ